MDKIKFVKTILIGFILFFMGNIVNAQDKKDVSEGAEVNGDTISTVLNEVEVIGRTQKVVKFGVEYIPDKKSKRIAHDASDLLSKMGLSQLRVSPGGGDVKTIDGQDVAMFIDYVPATSQDLEGLRPEDVLKVEVLNYPDDPRFGSAAHVVNFIMIHYEWGGYTKLSTSDFTTFPSNYESGSLYSKFLYKKWVFDVAAQGSWYNLSHTPSIEKINYRDFYYKDIFYKDVEKLTSSGNDVTEKNNTQWYSVRAGYFTDKIYLQQTFYFGRNGTPDKHSFIETIFDGISLPSTIAERMENSQSLYPGTNGYYQFFLPKGNTIIASWSFQYGATKRFSDYRLGGLEPIINYNKEKIYSPNLNIQYSKNFNHNNTLRLALMSYNSIYHTDYGGSFESNQHLLSSENMFFLEYMQNWEWGLSLYSRAGLSYVLGRLNGINELQQYNPRLGLQLQYLINNKNSVSIEGWWGNSHPEASTFNDALVQSDELLWLKGNPDLKNTLFNNVKASYNFIPNDKLSISALIDYTGNPDKRAWIFYTDPGFNGLIRQVVNSGTSHVLSSTVSTNLKFFNNSLILSLLGTYSYINMTGENSIKKNTWFGLITAQYQHSNWSLTAFYQSPQFDINAYSYGVITHQIDRYGLLCDLTLGDFKIGLYLINLFRKKEFKTTEFNSHHYSDYNKIWDLNTAQMIRLNLSYTFGYGLKIRQNNELNSSGSIDSAILK